MLTVVAQANQRSDSGQCIARMEQIPLVQNLRPRRNSRDSARSLCLKAWFAIISNCYFINNFDNTTDRLSEPVKTYPRDNGHQSDTNFDHPRDYSATLGVLAPGCVPLSRHIRHERIATSPAPNFICFSSASTHRSHAIDRTTLMTSLRLKF
jgi:hypothetical protein